MFKTLSKQIRLTLDAEEFIKLKISNREITEKEKEQIAKHLEEIDKPFITKEDIEEIIETRNLLPIDSVLMEVKSLNREYPKFFRDELFQVSAVQTNFSKYAESLIVLDDSLSVNPSYESGVVL